MRIVLSKPFVGRALAPARFVDTIAKTAAEQTPARKLGRRRLHDCDVARVVAPDADCRLCAGYRVTRDVATRTEASRC